jgi:5-formyltetrahydrofolate cyclo-ligase
VGEEGGAAMSEPNMKQTIRKNILAQREQLPADMRAAYSATITERLLQLPEYQQASAVLGYMNFGAEFASELWVGRAQAEGKRLALPKVNHHTNQLDLYWVDDLESQLAAGLWGIREPVVERCERLDRLNKVEFVLLPGVAFSRDGARLGYGKGYYDKLLSRLDDESGIAHRPALVAGAYSMQLVEDVPQDATDRKVEWLVTENETICCTA